MNTPQILNAIFTFIGLGALLEIGWCLKQIRDEIRAYSKLKQDLVFPAPLPPETK